MLWYFFLPLAVVEALAHTQTHTKMTQYSKSVSLSLQTKRHWSTRIFFFFFFYIVEDVLLMQCWTIYFSMQACYCFSALISWRSDSCGPQHEKANLSFCSCFLLLRSESHYIFFVLYGCALPFLRIFLSVQNQRIHLCLSCLTSCRKKIPISNLLLGDLFFPCFVHSFCLGYWIKSPFNKQLSNATQAA